MHATVLDAPPSRERMIVVAAVLLSVLLHAAAAAGAVRIERRPPEPEPVWVEMTVTTPPEPVPEELPPEPEPEPEPPKPKPRPDETVDFKETSDEPPPPDAPPPDPSRKPVRRMVQGLSNTSFVDGAQTGLSVRAGTTTAARATDELMDKDDATEFATVPYRAVAKSPRVKVRPLLTVPETLRAEGIAGAVEVELTIDAEGRVEAVEVLKRLHPDADAACVRDLKRTRWEPGEKDGAAVRVVGVPFTCRYQELP